MNNGTCDKNCGSNQINTCSSKGGNCFIILIVLYILLAIILGSRLY